MRPMTPTRRLVTAAPVALGLGVAAMLGTMPMTAAPAFAAETVSVTTASVATELARHLQVSPRDIPGSVTMPIKLAAAVCERSLADLRASGAGGCAAADVSQGLIKAVRDAMRGS